MRSGHWRRPHGSLPPVVAAAIAVAATTGSARDAPLEEWRDGRPLECSAGDGVAVALRVTDSTLSSPESGATDYLRLSVEPSDPLLDVEIFGEDGAGEIAWKPERSVSEGLPVLSDVPGGLILELRCRPREAAGTVIVRIVERRRATPSDLQRARAERLFQKAEETRLLNERLTIAEAGKAYQEARKLWESAGDLRQAAWACQRLGAVFEQTAEWDRALELYRAAVVLASQAGDRSLESEMRSTLGFSLARSGDPGRGAEECRMGFRLAQAADTVRGEAESFNCLGEVEYARGNREGAVAFHLRAELLWRGLGDLSGFARTEYLLGGAYSELSELQKAQRRLLRALDLWRALGNRRGELESLVAVGRLADRMGQYQSALNILGEATQLAEPMGDPLWQSSIQSGMALVYQRMGETGNARQRWQKALELSREAGVRMAELDMLLALGELDLESGDVDEALRRFRQCLLLSEDLENPFLKALALRFIGLTHRARGERTVALEYARQALSTLADQDRSLEALIRTDMADAHRGLSEVDQAREEYERARELSRETRDRLTESKALYGLARTSNLQGGLAAARRHVEEALRLTESLRSGVASPGLRASYVASIHQYHELHVDLLMRLDRERPDEGLAGEALAASERARARSLLETLAEARIDVRGGANPELLDREERLKRKLDGESERLMRLLAEGAGEEATKLEEEIDELTSSYDLLQAEIRSKSPRYAALTQPQPLDLAGIREKVIDPETLLLEYSLGDERSYLWAVSQGELRSHELPPRAEIERAARHLYDLLTARLPVPDETPAEARRRVREADEAYWAAAGELSEMLLGPVAEVLAGRRLLVVSDGALQFLPFAALPVPGTAGDPVPLIARHEVVHLPSASALAVLREREHGTKTTSDRTVAVLADPVFETDDPRVAPKAASAGQTGAEAVGSKGLVADLAASSMQSALRAVGFMQDGVISIPRLVATRREARAIAALAPEGTSFTALGFDANLATARSPDLGRYPIVHFATHGLVNAENPALSGILLSMVDESGEPQPGFLTLDDIYDLDLPAELVVLSACSTALGKEIRGEGLVGIVRGFLYAGAERVVASLWKVDDNAAGELMKRFYRHMLQENSSPAAALRQAQIEMWREGEFRQPFYWAAFVLQGEWR